MRLEHFQIDSQAHAMKNANDLTFEIANQISKIELLPENMMPTEKKMEKIQKKRVRVRNKK